MSARVQPKSRSNKRSTSAVDPAKTCNYPPLDRQIGVALANSMKEVAKRLSKAAFIMVLQSSAGYDIFPARPDTLQEYLDAEPTLMFVPTQSLLGPAATVGPIAALFKSECVRGRRIFDHAAYRSMLAKFETVHWSSLLHHGTVGLDVNGWRTKRENKELLVKQTAKSIAPRAVRETKPSTKSRKVAATPKDRLFQLFEKIQTDCAKQGVDDCEWDSKQTLNVTGYPEVMPKAKLRAAKPKLILNYEGTFLCSSDPHSFADAMVDLREAGLIAGAYIPGEYEDDGDDVVEEEDAAEDVVEEESDDAANAALDYIESDEEDAANAALDYTESDEEDFE